MADQSFSPTTKPHVGQSSRFNDLLLEAIDEVLCETLGDMTKRAVFAHLGRRYSLEVQDIPGELQEFSHVLEQVFGRSGKTVGYAICRRLFEKLGWRFTVMEGYDFLDYVEGAKVKLAQESTRRESNQLSREFYEGSQTWA